MNPNSKVPAFNTLCQLVKELNAFDYARFCEVANAPNKQLGTQLYCRVMTRLQESDNHAAQATGKAMKAFWDSTKRSMVIEEHWTADATGQPGVVDKKTDASKDNIRRLVARSTTRAVAHVAHLNDRLVAAYSDSVLQEAETQLTDLTSGNGEKTSADTFSQASQGSHSKANVKAKARAGNSNNREQRANVTEPAEDGFDAGTDAQGDTDADEDEAELTETSLYSPFCDLIKDLYRRFGHDQEKMKLLAKPISSPLVQELHAHARHLLETWREDDLINQKQLLVALSCIINTIDGDNAAFYDKFADHKKSCVVEGFMTPTQRQLDFVERMMQETNFLQTLDLDTLDIFSLRHACDLRVSFKQESSFFQVPNTEAMKEELTICSLVHILCNEILHSGNRACSEQEDVCLWRDVARALYHGDVIPRMGELSSHAVRYDRRRVEGAISRDRTSAQARGRKIDLFFHLEEKKLVELFCWEAKTADAGSIQLQVQRCKNLRLNACLIGTTHSVAGLDRRRPVYPLPSPLLLDIAGRTALPYKIHKINPDVFVAGAVREDKGLICLPRTKEDMVDFLREGGLSALLNIKLINDEYAATIKQAMRKVKKEEAKNRMLGYDSLDEERNPVINTPIKRYKVATTRMPALKRPQQKSPSKTK